VVSASLTLLIVFATVTFGAVYPWVYLPLFGAATCLGSIGLAGMLRRRSFPPGLRPLSVGLLVVIVTVAAQLVPLSRTALQAISPHTSDLLSQYSFVFAGGASRHPLSINPRATRVALIGLCSLTVYAIGLPGLLSRRDLRTVPRNLIVCAVLLAVAGIYGREHNNGLVYGFWQPGEGTNANGFGPFVNRNHFAGWMLMTTCLTLGALCGWIERARGSAKPDLRNRLVWFSTAEANRIVLMAAAAATMAVSLIWTMSRSGIISFACAIGCFLWLVARRRGLGRWHRAAIVTTLGLLLFTGVNWRGFDRIAAWFGDTRDLVDRTAAWRDGWQVVHDFPLAGTGINTYADAMLFYQKHVLEFWMSRAHNDYLQLLAEGGLLVVVPAAMAIVLLAVAVRRRVRQSTGDSYDYWVRAGAGVGLLAIGIQETVEFSLQIPANALLFATLAAVAISPYSARRVAE